MRIALLLLLPLLAQDAVEKAKKTLEKSPDDPAANLTVGRANLTTGDFEGALPYLLKGSDASLKAAAKAESASEGSKALLALEAGDLWAQAMSKNRPLRQPCLDRASYWYARAWSDLDALYQMKLRERLVKLYAPVAPGGGKLPQGWSSPQFSAGASRVHSGGGALRVASKKDGKLASLGMLDVPATRGKVFEFSAWVSSEGTDAQADKIKVALLDAQRKPVWVKEYFIAPDMPVWVRVGDKIDAPDGAMTLNLEVLGNSTKGCLWIDDVSAKIDGKELLKGGNFEP